MGREGKESGGGAGCPAVRGCESARRARGRETRRDRGAGIDRVVGDTYIFANTLSPVLQGWKVKRANDDARSRYPVQIR